MASGGAAFHFDDHLCRSNLAGDADHLTDLFDGSRLERHVGEALGVERADKLHRLVEFRDARGNDHAINRGAARTLFRHDALRAELQVPQVAVHEHGVEFNGPAFFELRFEFGHMAVEHACRNLAATREFRPIAGVGRGRHDLRIDGGGGHARQQHRGLSCEFGERGAHLVSGRGADDLRSEAFPILGTLRQGLQR